MVVSVTCKNQFQPDMVRSLTCHHLFVRLLASDPACYGAFLSMPSVVPSHAEFCSDMSRSVPSTPALVPSCHHLLLRSRSPIRLCHSASANVTHPTTGQRAMNVPQYKREETGIIKAHNEMVERVEFRSKCDRSLITKFLSVTIRSLTRMNLLHPIMARSSTCHHLFLSMLAPEPAYHGPFLSMSSSVHSHREFCSDMSRSVPSHAGSGSIMSPTAASLEITH